MSNHFHILLCVPPRPQVLPTDEELLHRIEQLSGRPGRSSTRQQLQQLRASGLHEAAEELRMKFFRRMWDVSAFMKLLKQRFSQWLNPRQGRVGTLWEGRFDSVLVEGKGDPLMTIAAYVDLNPVRARITENPVTYRWSGFAQAMAGKSLALGGLKKLTELGGYSSKEDSAINALQSYRKFLFAYGEENDGLTEHGYPLRKGIAREEVLKVVLNKGQVPLHEFLRLRVRYFVHGTVIGRREFVEELAVKLQHPLRAKTSNGAQPIDGVTGIFSLKKINRQPVYA
jgi:hypothetical protein